MTETILGLLRHGQTDWNIDLRLQGITDIPMNKVGHAQAEAAAEALDPLAWQVLLTSPLTRAIETANAVQQRLKRAEVALELSVHEGLLERSFGQAEGLTYDEWKQNFQADAAEVPGAETMDQLRSRAEKFLAELVETHAGRRVLAVSHGALIRMFLSIASAEFLPPAGERISNACFNVLRHSDSGWSVEVYEPRPLTADLADRYRL